MPNLPCAPCIRHTGWTRYRVFARGRSGTPGMGAAMPIGGSVTRGSRVLLRQIREALGGAGAGATPAQDRLNMVVQIIAQSMVAEVCSIYLRRASGELELFATEGLNPDAVHNTRLRA